MIVKLAKFIECHKINKLGSVNSHIFPSKFLLSKGNYFNIFFIEYRNKKMKTDLCVPYLTLHTI